MSESDEQSESEDGTSSGRDDSEDEPKVEVHLPNLEYIAAGRRVAASGGRISVEATEKMLKAVLKKISGLVGEAAKGTLTSTGADDLEITMGFTVAAEPGGATRLIVNASGQANVKVTVSWSSDET
jgi:hypothetical protein